MSYPNSPFMVLYNAYRIVRQGDPAGESSRDALFFVQRPDGSECCRDVTWAQAEPAIRTDMAKNDWPADGLPPEPASGDGHGRLAPLTPIPAAKPKRARARPAARPR